MWLNKLTKKKKKTNKLNMIFNNRHLRNKYNFQKHNTELGAHTFFQAMSSIK